MKVKVDRKIILMYICILIIAFVSSLSLSSSLFSNEFPAHDSSMFQYFGFAMNKGLYMYKDIFDHKGPILFFMNYVATLLGSKGLFFVEYICLCMFYYYVYRMSKLWLNNVSTIVVMVLTSLVLPDLFGGGNYSESYAIPFIMMALYTFSKYFIYFDLSKLDLVGLGGSFAIVALIRFNMVGVWVAFVVMILLQLILKKYYKNIVRYMLYFTMGLLIVVIPIIVYLYLTQSLSEAVYQVVTYNILYLSKSESISLLDTIYRLIIKTEMIVMMISFGVCILVNKVKWYELSFYLSGIISFVTVLLSNRAYIHYLIVLIPLFSTALILIFRNYKSNNYVKLVFAMILAMLPLILVNMQKMMQVNLSYNNKILFVSQDVTNFVSYRDNNNRIVMDVVEYIKNNTNEMDKIYAHRTSGLLYLKSERLANTKYFNLPAADITDNNKITTEFFYDMYNDSPKLIVTNRGFVDGDNNGFEYEVQSYIKKDYILAYQNEYYSVYKPK